MINKCINMKRAKVGDDSPKNELFQMTRSTGIANMMPALETLYSFVGNKPREFLFVLRDAINGRYGQLSRDEYIKLSVQLVVCYTQVEHFYEALALLDELLTVVDDENEELMTQIRDHYNYLLYRNGDIDINVYRSKVYDYGGGNKTYDHMVGEVVSGRKWVPIPSMSSMNQANYTDVCALISAGFNVIRAEKGTRTWFTWERNTVQFWKTVLVRTVEMYSELPMPLFKYYPDMRSMRRHDEFVLRELYMTYLPSKLGNVDVICRLYENNPEEMLPNITKKYGLKLKKNGKVIWWT